MSDLQSIQSDKSRQLLSFRKTDQKQSGTALLLRSINSVKQGSEKVVERQFENKKLTTKVPKLDLKQSFEENIHPNIQMDQQQQIGKEIEDNTLIMAITQLGGQVRNLIGSQKRSRELENTQAQKRVKELISNLEAKNLKLSEINKQLLEEAAEIQGSEYSLMESTLQRGKSQTSTINFLTTLNQIIMSSTISPDQQEAELETEEQEQENLKQEISELKLELKRIRTEYQMDLRELKVENEHLLRDRDQYKDVFERLSLQNYDWEVSKKYENLKEIVEKLTLESIINNEASCDFKLLEVEPKCWRSIHLLIEDVKKLTNISGDYPIRREDYIVKKIDIEPTPRFSGETPNSKLGQTNLIDTSNFQSCFNTYANLQPLLNLASQRPDKSADINQLWPYIEQLELKAGFLQNQFQNQQLSLSQFDLAQQLDTNKNSQLLDEQLQKIMQQDQIQNIKQQLLQTIRSCEFNDNFDASSPLNTIIVPDFMGNKLTQNQKKDVKIIDAQLKPKGDNDEYSFSNTLHSNMSFQNTEEPIAIHDEINFGFKNRQNNLEEQNQAFNVEIIKLKEELQKVQQERQSLEEVISKFLSDSWTITNLEQKIVTYIKAQAEFIYRSQFMPELNLRKDKVNSKLQKLRAKQELLNEKYQQMSMRENQLEMIEHQLECRRQALDDEWHRSDERRDYLLQMEREILRKEQAIDLKAREMEHFRDLKRQHSLKEKNIEDLRVQLEVREREIVKREKKTERELERVLRAEREIQQEREDLDKDREIIERAKSQGQHLDVQRLVKRAAQSKSFIGDGGKAKEDKTRVIKSSSSVTNMNAYINKCQNCCEKESGLYKCELHKSVLNKSQISLGQMSVNYGIRNYQTLQSSQSVAAQSIKSYHTQVDNLPKQLANYDSQTSTQKPPLQKINTYKRADDEEVSKTSRAQLYNFPRPYIQKQELKLKSSNLSFDSFLREQQKPVNQTYTSVEIEEEEEDNVPFCDDEEFSRIEVIRQQEEDVPSSASNSNEKESTKFRNNRGRGFTRDELI